MKLEGQRAALKEELKQYEEGPKFVELSAKLMDVEFQINTIRRRTFGNVQFIGELFNCGLLRFKDVIQSCFDTLITDPEHADDEKTEALCKLLTTVGKTMYDNPRFSDLLETTMDKIAPLCESKSLTSRVRFAVRDLIELAEGMWKSDEKEKLEKLSDIRMKKTIEKLESIVESARRAAVTRRMLEKKTSHRKSQRVHTPRDEEPAAEEVPSEVVPVAEVQIDQRVVDEVRARRGGEA